MVTQVSPEIKATDREVSCAWAISISHQALQEPIPRSQWGQRRVAAVFSAGVSLACLLRGGKGPVTSTSELVVWFGGVRDQGVVSHLPFTKAWGEDPQNTSSFHQLRVT